MNCPNCKAKLSCSCKLRVSSNGTQCCTNCISTLENRVSNTVSNGNQNPQIVKVSVK